jgi:SAM-dependent methyltransferase
VEIQADRLTTSTRKEQKQQRERPNMTNVEQDAWRFRRYSQGKANNVSQAYDYVAEQYGHYADGDGMHDFSAGSDFEHADALVWGAIRTAIEEIASAGRPVLRVLDAGCGPGTWTARAAGYAIRTGISVEVVGCDISREQLDIACRNTAHLEWNGSSAPVLQFLELDLSQPLPWADGTFDLVLSNFAVLNHLSRRDLPRAVRELCRVARYRVLATLRALGSPPTACIVGLDKVQSYYFDGARQELSLALKDGSRHSLTFNLYSAEAIRELFEANATVVDLRGVNLFVARFVPQANWTKGLVERLPARGDLMQKLKELEEPLCRLPGWVDHGTHVLVVAQPKRS